MQLKSLLLALTTVALAHAAALPELARSSAPDHTDLAIDVITDSFDITKRGNVPDHTDLARDIIPESKVPHHSTLNARQIELVKATENLIFGSTISQFLSAKKDGSPEGLDWSDNGCSNSPDKPFGFNFLPSCQRHDFGYRNFKAQSRFTEDNRKRIDDQFKIDLYKECEPKDVISRGACKGTADVYYAAVRAFGGL